jgi:hypothetical protein
MAKPTIVTRAGKGSALTWTEGDANLTNLRDATITVQAGTGGTNVVSDLNGTVTLVAGTNITLSGDNTAKTVTINSTASGGATTLDGLTDVVITAAANGKLIQHNGTNWVDVNASSVNVGSADTATLAATATNANNINISTNTGNAADTTTYPVLVGASTTGNQAPHTHSATLTYNASTGTLAATTFSGALSGNATTATTLATARAIYGNNFDGSTALTQIIASTYGGTGNGFTKFTGPASTEKTFTLPNSSATLLYEGGSIGATTPASGAFTTLSASSTFTTTASTNFNNTAGAKLTTGASAVSAIGWTTSGIGLRIQGASYTDTSSTGTIANSHVHALGTPTIASSNTITVTDAGTLYIQGAPTAGTNTTITNAWALLTPGNIKAANMTLTGTLTGTASKATNLVGGNATTLLGSIPYQSGTDTTTLLSPNTTTTQKFLTQVGDGTNGMAPMWSTIASLNNVIIGSTGAAAGTFTTLTASTTGTTGTLNITYNPSSASGAAIQATGKDSQGGVGYFDFLKTTNTTSGATNANKTFRTNSTGALEIINSAYTGTILSLTDAGALTVGGTTLPTATGTTGQVLTLSSAGTAAWSTPSSGGSNIVVLSSSGGSQFQFPATSNAVSTSYFNLETAGGISGVSVNTTNKTFTLPAGTYILEMPACFSSNATYFDIFFNNQTDGTDTTITYFYGITVQSTSRAYYYGSYKFTIAATKTFRFMNSTSANASWSLQNPSGTMIFKIYKTA